MLASSMFLLLSAQSAAVDNRAFPTEKPGAVLQSPNWSDYRIYPSSAARNNHEGRVGAETLIGTDGVPKACRIIQSSSFADLDDGTCSLLMQMRFVPARNAAGTAIESRYLGNVNWRLTDALPWGSSAIRLSGRIRDGRVVECRPVAGEGPYTQLWTIGGCSYLADVGYFFGPHSGDDAAFTVEYRLDAGDNSRTLQASWAPGVAVAHEKVTFYVTPSGDPGNCVAIESAGFGRRGIRTLPPCGAMLSILYFQPIPGRAPPHPRRGTFETRVYVDRTAG